MEPDQQIEYHWIDEVKRLESYVPGGYHPIMIDDLLHDRYRVVDKLGHGSYSTIWLCHDVRLKRYVAVKVGISEPSLPRRELAILRDLSGSTSHAATGSHPPSPKLALAVTFINSRGVVHGDIHLWNVLVRLPAAFDELSVKQFRDAYGEPETEPITRIDGEPLTPNVPPRAVVPQYLGKQAEEFVLEDARGLVLSDCLLEGLHQEPKSRH